MVSKHFEFLEVYFHLQNHCMQLLLCWRQRDTDGHIKGGKIFNTKLYKKKHTTYNIQFNNHTHIQVLIWFKQSTTKYNKTSTWRMLLLGKTLHYSLPDINEGNSQGSRQSYYLQRLYPRAHLLFPWFQRFLPMPSHD